jgi:hypothetical protein
VQASAKINKQPGEREAMERSALGVNYDSGRIIVGGAAE